MHYLFAQLRHLWVSFKLPYRFFFLLIFIELGVSLLLRRQVYRFNDSISDLSCGIISQVTGLGLKIILVVGYAFLVQYISVQALFGAPEWVWQNWSAASILTWVFAFVLYDFCYYWAHRMAHDTRLGWIAHIVHHSSEEYNLTVALRQSAFQSLFTMWFYLPMVFLGIPWEVFVVCGAINLLYQFWIHTRLIKHLGPLEWVLNTPSHHRVHHGRNPKYIDRNHGGTFILFDRLFGTFEQEADEPVYGTTQPLQTWNPVWANLEGPVDTLRMMRRARGLDKLKLLFMKPGWQPDYMGGPLAVPEVDAQTHEKFDQPVPKAITFYVLIQFILTVPLTLFLLGNAADMPLPNAIGLGSFIVLTLMTMGGLHDKAKWAYVFEGTRIAAVLAGALGYWFTASASARPAPRLAVLGHCGHRRHQRVVAGCAIPVVLFEGARYESH